MLYVIESKDTAYVETVHKMLQNKFTGNMDVFANSKVIFHNANVKMELAKALRDGNHKYVITTSMAFVKTLFPTIEGNSKDNRGLVFTIGDVRVIHVEGFNQFYTVPSFEFMLVHWVRKLLCIDSSILEKDKFIWKKVESTELFEQAMKVGKTASLCAVDIETGPKEFLVITSCSYTFMVGNRTVTFVIPVNGLQEIQWIRALNDLPVPKVLQNGSYDSAYFLRFGCPLRNYLFDTYTMFHCMYQELDKDLAFMSSFFLQDFVFWKNEAKENLYEYNGKDTHNTMWVFIAQMKHLQQYAPWAFKNYLHEFPMVFPFLAMQLEGVAVDYNALNAANENLNAQANEANSELQALLGVSYFNCRSSKQVLQMLAAMEEFFPPSQRKKYESSTEATLKDWSYRHPVMQRIYDKIINARKSSKLTSTYLKPEKFLHGRLLAHIDSSGTETGRGASKASHFWCGHNMQNIPASIKDIYVADAGYTLFEVDKSQAESWCTGYLSNNSKLIKILKESPDFHCTNASMFFGIPFNELYDVETGKKLNKDIRDLAKRVNHGANYNMAAMVLLQTMGIKNVLKAQMLLKLNPVWSPIRVCAHLLQQFDRQYPGLRDTERGYYSRVIREVMSTGKLVGPTGYTRRTFLNPTKSKHALNALVAHPSQSLSVLLVNKAVLKIFVKTLHEWDGLVRLKAQIHDSIFGEVAEGHEHIVKEIEQLMRVPVTVKGREMIIPGDVGKLGKKVWADMK